MVALSVTWHALMDYRTCPICMAINGYTWMETIGPGVGTTVSTVQGGFRTFLVHPTYGVVWDMQQGSKAHGHERYNCRCHVTAEVDLSDLRRRIEAIYNIVKAKYA